jgi:hypothetical protein
MAYRKVSGINLEKGGSIAMLLPFSGLKNLLLYRK